jgi:thiamine-monophosphate kinase
MDISDGFVGDLRKMALASDVSMEVQATALPFSPQVHDSLALPGAMMAALTGGDDYQILFTVSPAQLDAFRQAVALQNVKVTQIGRVLPADAQAPVVIRELKGVDLTASPGSYSHF